MTVNTGTDEILVFFLNTIFWCDIVWKFKLVIYIYISINFILESAIYLVLVALLWGVTNPLIKKGASGLENVEAKTSYGQFFKELYFLFTNAKVSVLLYNRNKTNYCVLIDSNLY